MEKKTPEQEAQEFTDAREATILDLDAIMDLLESSEYLTVWETMFLSSLRSTLERDRDLSIKQEAILNKLVTQVAERYA